ncbi:uncharacterized protein LOC119839398 [Zerene cesonia]|uniref:uncharacterized protein LOC119839398 n=1 Tax=Zerene cesonia TaxID=33412 RepID=UPI0018E5374B|nr:uncharacterized protein LOC119839398 [Zerene cesonia]
MEGYFGCLVDGPLHRFPQWEDFKEERFNKWKSVLDPIIQAKGNEYIYNNIRLCYRHFDWECYSNIKYCWITNVFWRTIHIRITSFKRKDAQFESIWSECSTKRMCGHC